MFILCSRKLSREKNFCGLLVGVAAKRCHIPQFRGENFRVVSQEECGSGWDTKDCNLQMSSQPTSDVSNAANVLKGGCFVGGATHEGVSHSSMVHSNITVYRN